MIVIGVDENGLGPMLGPMVVTACAFQTPAYDANTFWSLAGADLPADDSKVVFKQNKKGSAESACLKWLSLFSHVPATAAELYASVCRPIDTPCPDGKGAVCRASNALRIPQYGALSEPPSLSAMQRFEQTQIAPLCVGAYAICPGLFNQSVGSGNQNKLQFDFSLMMRLVEWIHSQYPNEPMLALCGKVGGTTRYLNWFSDNGTTDMVALEECSAISRYKGTSDNEIHFTKDSDSAHLPVAVASMIGKYVRELHMTEINQLLWNCPSHVSGYHDPRTREFAKQTEEKRIEIGLPAECFIRNG